MRIKTVARGSKLGRRLLLAISALVLALGFATQPPGSPGVAVAGTVARTGVVMPPFEPPPVPVSFADNPTDQAILTSGVFRQPLLPIGSTTRQDNVQLAQSLVRYQEAERTGASEAIQVLEEYLASNPRSPWRDALLLNVGAIYRVTGHFSKALSAWETAWSETRDLGDAHARAIGNATAAYLSQFYAYLGRKDELTALLRVTGERHIGGSAQELISESARGLSDMVNRPGISFKCGPLALAKILKQQHSPDLTSKLQLIDETPSTPEGLSLLNVRDLSDRVGLHYQMAFRSPGAALPLPAVVHWGVNHFGAVQALDSSGRYVVGDATFGDTLRVAPKTLDEEASGYFLIPPGPLPAGWRSVAAEEAGGIWGRGNTGNNRDNGATGPNDVKAFPCKDKDDGGCTAWNVQAAVVGLTLHDNPIGYRPPVGPVVDFPIYYSQRDAQQPMTSLVYTNFGPLWTSGWFSYLITTPNQYEGACPGDYVETVPSGTGTTTETFDPNSCLTLYGRGGGTETFVFPNNCTVQGNCTTSLQSQPSSFSYSTITTTPGSNGNIAAYTRTLPDGSQEQFTAGPHGGAGSFYFLTSVNDAQGNTVSIQYDWNTLRIIALVDPLNQVTTICYNNSGSPCTFTQSANAPDQWHVTQVVDPFGRSAQFGYDSSGRLTSITDTVGIVSTYTYTSPIAPSTYSPDFITSLAVSSPTGGYGTTYFAYGDETNLPTNSPTSAAATRLLMVSDGAGRVSRVEFSQGAPAQSPNGTPETCPTPASMNAPGGLPSPPSLLPCSDQVVPSNITSFFNHFLEHRNTFVWNPVQLEDATAAVPAGKAPTCTNLGAIELMQVNSAAVAGCLTPASNSYAAYYNYATQLHWLHTQPNDTANNVQDTSRVLESVKPPFQTRIWYQYQNQTSVSSSTNDPTFPTSSFNKPTTISRLLCPNNVNQACNSSTQTQLWTYSYHPLTGNVTSETDPLGRTYTYAYNASPTLFPGTDLLSITNTTNGRGDPVLTLGNYVQHRPQSITGANGQTTTVQYNGPGQVAIITDPMGDTWTFTYSTVGQSTSARQSSGPNGPLPANAGFLQSIKGSGAPASNDSTTPLQVPTTSFTYDGFERVATVTDVANVPTTFGYDNANRLTSELFADGTKLTLQYRVLDLQEVVDRKGNVNQFFYNNDRELTQAIDGAGRLVVINRYDDGTIQSIQDPLPGHVTTYTRDAVGSPTQIVFADNSSRLLYYDQAERLTEITEIPVSNPGLASTYVERGLSYNIDNTLQGVITYTPAGTGSSNVYQYDSAYKRLTYVRNETGDERAYYYYPISSTPTLGAGLVQTITDSVNYDEVEYGYDALNRQTSELITANAAQNGQTIDGVVYVSPTYYDVRGFDGNGRLNADSNSLDNDYQYVFGDATARPTSMTSSAGPQIAMTYYGGTGDEMLRTLAYGANQNVASEVFSDLAYSYDANDNVVQAEHLGEAGNIPVPGLPPTNLGVSATYDGANQLETLSSIATGDLAALFICDNAGDLSVDSTQSGFAPTYNSVDEMQNGGTPVTYDFRGNLTQLPASASSLGPASYTYDNLGRLTTATTSTGTSTYSYDGTDHLVRLVQTNTAGQVVGNLSYFWCADRICLEHDNLFGGVFPPPVSTVYYPQGVIVGTGNQPVGGAPYGLGPSDTLYYLRDGHGSVLGTVESSYLGGMVSMESQYDAFGVVSAAPGYQKTQTGGLTVGYSGYMYDSMSGLDLAEHRAYAAPLRRWLSRDPLGQTRAFSDLVHFNADALNPYAYVDSNPVSMSDSSGLWGVGLAASFSAEAGWGGGFAAQASTGWGYFSDQRTGDTSAGMYLSYGQAGDYPDDVVYGLSGGMGVGSVWLTNANEAADLEGDFSVFNLSLPLIGIEWAWGGGTWQLSVTPPFQYANIGASWSQYHTTTMPTKSVPLSRNPCRMSWSVTEPQN